mgnify:FL=1
MLHKVSSKIYKFIGEFFILLVKIYQVTLSPLLGSNCRFSPTCSNYAIEAIRVYGPLKGSILAMKRIIKCHPFNKGGVDQVPNKD